MTALQVDRRRALALAGVVLVTTGAGATPPHAHQPAPAQPAAEPPAADTGKLPPAITTQHALQLPNRTLRFSATAGAIPLSDDAGKPLAEIAFVAYQLDGADRMRRPVTFVFNGGPGFASAWLQLGAVGPWRIPLGGETTSPSATPAPEPNADTWLDFTDLVFIDPAGTGYSQVLATNDKERHSLWSVDGDIAYLAKTIRLWLDRYQRPLSPKYILGESYGGFRAPRLARELESKQGTGIAGLVLVSPALEMPARNRAFDPFYYVTRLPSMAAAAMAQHGTVARAQLADVEQYATTEYLVDLTRGERDQAAVERRSAHVATYTGIDLQLVRRHGGMLDTNLFLHALYPQGRRVGSPYEATVSAANPYPLETLANAPDPILEGLWAPVSSAMVAVYETQLQWRPSREYRLGNLAISRQWDWGHGIDNRPQAMGALRNALALDPRLKVAIGQGFFDLVVPYMATQLLLDQIPASVGMERVRFTVHPGGHMFYTNDASRAAWRSSAAAMYGA